MMNEEKAISITIWNCKVMSKKSVTGPKNCLFQKNLTVYKLIKYLTVFSQDMFIYIASDMSPFKCAYSSVQSLSPVRLFATPWIAARQASLSITDSRSSLRLTLTSIESVMPSRHLLLCRPLFLLPPIPSCIRVFSNESTLRMRWPKYWNFSFSIIPSKEHPGLISFRMDWLDVLAVQGTPKSLLQHHSSKASILQHSAFFTVQLSHPYMTTGKTIALTRWTFVGKIMSLLFNMLSRLVITFLPRSKCLLISWLQSPSAVIFKPQKIKSTLFPLFPHLFPMGPGAMIFVFGLLFLKSENFWSKHITFTLCLPGLLIWNSSFWCGLLLVWRRKWQPTPVCLPGESHGQRSLVGYSPWGHKELGTTERPYLLLLVSKSN